MLYRILSQTQKIFVYSRFLHPLKLQQVNLPERMPSPFAQQPHPLALNAAQDLQHRLERNLIPGHDFFSRNDGRQFGVLVGQTMLGELAYLSAFSHEVNGQSSMPGFVPPLSNSSSVSGALTLQNRLEEQRSLGAFFPESPPAGAGCCAAPKLIDYANKGGLQILAMTEFWWGHPPPDIVRHHGHFYPACRGKCGPILPFLLEGTAVEERPEPFVLPAGDELEVIYEDSDLLLINKPSGLLSVPGKLITDSVLTRLRKRLPDASGALLLHRLDLSTSGLLLAAKSATIYKRLQQQFMRREIKKTYIAVLDGELKQGSGVINLPLRVDLDDRPRQMVCDSFGKAALTRWQRLSVAQGKTRVNLYPETGRTHQLRVHASHVRGLNLPVVGDELYGQPKERLMLHACELTFLHPVTRRSLRVSSPTPF